MKCLSRYYRYVYVYVYVWPVIETLYLCLWAHIVTEIRTNSSWSFIATLHPNIIFNPVLWPVKGYKNKEFCGETRFGNAV